MHVNNIKSKLLAEFCVANNINPPLNASDVTWSNPELWVEGDCNTRVTMTVNAEHSKYKGDVVLNFNRYPISTALVGVKIPGKLSDYKGLYEVIDRLKNDLGLPMERIEYFNSPVRTDPLTIMPSTNSMAYLPSFSVELAFQDS